MLGGPDRQRRLHARHVWRGRQFAGQEFLKALQVAADDFQDKIDLAVEHVAFAHFGQLRHVVFKFAERAFGLALQTDHGEHRDRKAELRCVEIGVISFDNAFFLQRANAAQTRWRSQADAVRQFNIRDAPFVLQFSKQFAVDFVKIGQCMRPL